MLLIHKGVVHPWLCDIMGHMTTRNYLAMFDDASYHMIHETFGWTGGEGGASANGEARRNGWVDVRQVIEYRDELKAGDLTEVKGAMKKIGTKSVTYYYELYNARTGNLSATLETTSVYFDLKERVGVPLTDEMRAGAEKYLLPD